MSQENVELVRAGLAAMAAGDREGALARIDPDCVVDATRNVFNPGTYVGHDGMRKLWAGMDETWAEMRVEPLEFIDAGDQVVVIGRLVGRGKGSGVEVERFNRQVFTLREGRVVRFEIGFTDRDAVLKAAGLSE
jgi:ketosteroid isomerase-like protein